ncbi:hypothetical protein JCM1840_006362 [Sporobolomyces johnsonii]
MGTVSADASSLRLPVQSLGSCAINSSLSDGHSSTSTFNLRRSANPSAKAKVETAHVDGADEAPRKVAPKKASNHPPRPPNAWICYRSARVHELKSVAHYSKMPQADISKLVGKLWRTESAEVRKRYELEAAAKKLEHKEKYPEYTFRPVRKESSNKRASKKAKPVKKPLPSSVVGPPYSYPSYELPTPPSLAASSSSLGSSAASAASEPDISYFSGAPPPSFAQEEPFLPPTSYALSAWQTYQPITTYQLPPTPPQEHYVSPSQLGGSSTMFPPAAGQAFFPPPLTSTFTFTPPSTPASVFFDDRWTTGAASYADFVDLPYSYAA